MILAVLFVLVMIVAAAVEHVSVRTIRGRALTTGQESSSQTFTVAAILSVATWLPGMRAGVRALQAMDRTFVAITWASQKIDADDVDRNAAR